MAFLHIDMNCAYLERAALEYFWNRLSPGAFVLLDDYAYYGFEYQADAIDAVARSLGFSVLSYRPRLDRETLRIQLPHGAAREVADYNCEYETEHDRGRSFHHCSSSNRLSNSSVPRPLK